MQTRIYQPTPRNLRFLADCLRQDELVAVPAETVYGLAGNGLSARACARIFAAKDRPAHDPLILHLASTEEAPALCYWSDAAQKLADAFWPGPLTLVLPKREHVPDIATSGLPSVALRAPQHPVFRDLLRQAGIPLAAPSANPFGYISPTSAQHVKDSLDGRIAHILDGGDCPVGIESTVLDLRDPTAPRILRPGVITAEAVSHCLGLPVPATPAESVPASVAPGQLDKHYSPRTPLQLVDARPASLEEDEAFVAFTGTEQPSHPRLHFLSTDGTGETAARNLFRLLRQLDGQKLQRIYLERPPAGSSFRDALLDRMTRAAQK